MHTQSTSKPNVWFGHWMNFVTLTGDHTSSEYLDEVYAEVPEALRTTGRLTLYADHTEALQRLMAKVMNDGLKKTIHLGWHGLD